MKFDGVQIVDSNAEILARLGPEEYQRLLRLWADLINVLKKHDERVLYDAGVITRAAPEA